MAVTLPHVTLKHSNVVLLLLALMFVADSATTILLAIDSPVWRLSIVVRLLAQAYFMWLLSRTRRGLLILGYIGVIYGLFMLGSLFPLDPFSLNSWVENFSTLNKMLFVFVCWGVFQSYFCTPHAQGRLFRLFEVIAVIMIVSIYVGFVLRIELFKSYPEVERFGYKGLIPALNEASAYFLIVFFYYLQRLYTTRRGLPMLFLIAGAAILTGAKVALALPMLLVVLSLQWVMNRRMGHTALWIMAAIGAAAVLALVFRDAILTQFAGTISYFSSRWVQGQGLSSLFVSGRDQTVGAFLDHQLPDFRIGNYLFGGWDFSTYTTEMDVVDVFAFLGLIGGIVFYAGYISLLAGPLRRVPPLRFVFVLVWLGVSALAGHLVFSAVNSAYLAILLTFFAVTQQEQSAEAAARPIKAPQHAMEPVSA